MNKKAFTLVELIVVITILAILGTIAFISLNGYSKSARDSSRIMDLNNTNTSLELFVLQTGYYPEPTNPTTITYSGGEVWSQGTLGDDVVSMLQRLSKKPVDPLTENEYTYSRLNSKKEYELSAVMEDSGVALNNQVLAGDMAGSAYVNGTFNGVIAKVSTGAEVYVLAVPSIITSDLATTQYENLVADKLVFKGQKNLPPSYDGTTFNTTGGFTSGVNPSNIVVYSSGGTLPSNDTEVTTLVNNLKTAYNSSNITTNDQILAVLNVQSADEIKILGDNLVKEKLGVKTVTSTDTGGGQENNGPTPGVDYQVFQETGANANIALIGTNSLDQNSFSASSFAINFEPYAGFDGHVYTTQINTEAPIYERNGKWMSESGNHTNQNLTVNFGANVYINGFRIYQTGTHSRNAKNISFQTSTNGTDWDTHTSIVLSNQQDASGLQSITPVIAQYARLEVVDNYGDVSYTQIGYFEVFQEQSTLAGTNTSCKDVLTNNSWAPNGKYTINPGTGNIEVYCDMDNGGWTLVAGIDNTNGNHLNTAALTPENLTSISGKGKLSDSDINALKTETIMMICKGNKTYFKMDSNFGSLTETSTYSNFSCSTDLSTWYNLSGSTNNGLGTYDGSSYICGDIIAYGHPTFDGCYYGTSNGNGTLWVK